MPHPFRTLTRVLGASVCSLALSTAPAAAQRPDSAGNTDSTPAHVHTLPIVRVVAAPTRRADAATTVIVLPEAIATVPANDAWDILRQTAGLEVHLQGQGPGFASDAAMRGFTSDHSVDVAAFVDGLPLNEPVSGHAEGYADWNALIPEAVKRVEATKGPASPWAGNWAMGGSVNVLTEQSRLGTEWSARVGSYGDARLALLTGAEHPSGGWLLAADAQRSDGWRDNSQEAIGHVMWNGVWNGADAHTFTLAVSGYGGQWHSPGYITTAQYDSGLVKQAANPTDGGNEIFGSLRVAFTQPMGGEKGNFESSLYAHGGSWHIFLTIPPEGGIGEGVPSQTEELDQRVGVGGVTKYSRQMGDVHLITGLEYRAVSAGYQRYFTTDRARDSIFYFDTKKTPANLDAVYLALSPVAEAHWDIAPQLSLGLGGRLDWLSYRSQQRNGGPAAAADRLVATPKLSALYRISDPLSVYVSYNGGFRSSDGVIVTPSLPPALEDATELGVHYSARRAEGSIAFFLIDVHNQQTVDPITLQPSAGGTTRQQGVELDGRVGLNGWLSLFAHATVNDAHYVHLVTGSGADLAGVPVYQVADATVQGGFDFDLQEGLIAGSLGAAYTGPWTPVNQPDVRTSSYTLVNLRAVVPLSGEWSAAIGVQNILDTRYVEVQASGYVSPGQPRAIMATIRHGF